jgi:hypothetical protein
MRVWDVLVKCQPRRIFDMNCPLLSNVLAHTNVSEYSICRLVHHRDMRTSIRAAGQYTVRPSHQERGTPAGRRVCDGAYDGLASKVRLVLACTVQYIHSKLLA